MTIISGLHDYVRSQILTQNAAYLSVVPLNYCKETAPLPGLYESFDCIVWASELISFREQICFEQVLSR